MADEADPAQIIAASNRAYFQAYQRNAKLMGLLEQVAGIDPEFAVLRRNRAEAFMVRNARSIENLQDRGLADPELDPMLASRALSEMVSRLAFNHFVAGYSGTAAPALDDVIDTANRVWVNALRIGV